MDGPALCVGADVHRDETVIWAVTKADSHEVTERFRVINSLPGAEPAATAELKVVHPNDYWTKHPLTHLRYDSPTRLAWAVTLTQGQAGHGYEMIVWVDATDGEVLGGTQSSGIGPTQDETAGRSESEVAPSRFLRMIASVAGALALAGLLAGAVVWRRRRV